VWKEYENGTTIGKFGSEGGKIIHDEEYNSQCNITLEECPEYFAVTCGINGLMMHTVFCDREHSESTYNSMKTDLQNFLDSETTEEEACKFCEKFTAEY
jgi:hypothetical protein